MSAVLLNAAIAGLPPDGIDLRNLRGVTNAVGGRLVDKERALLEPLLQEWRRFTDDALCGLEALLGKAAPCRRAVKFDLANRWKTDIREQSSLTYISREAGFVLVDDETSKLWHLPYPVRGQGKLEAEALRKNDGVMDGLEGSTYDRASHSLLTVSEDSNQVFELKLTLDGAAIDLGRPKLRGKLNKPDGDPNKGWEGLRVLPAAQSPDRAAHILAVQESDPPKLSIFNRKTLKFETDVLLPPELAHVRDLSDLAIDPITGDLFLLSDMDNTVYQMGLRAISRPFGGQMLTEWSLVYIGENPVPKLETGGRMQAEGIDFDERGRLFLAGEAGRALLELHRR